MSDDIRVLSNLTMARNAKFNVGESVDSFPENANYSDIVVVQGVPYFYTQVSGVDTWFPLAQRQNTYLHTQGVDALEWLVNHGLGTVNLIVMVYDQGGNVQQAAIEFIDNENIRIKFSVATRGRAVLFGMDQISAPSVKAEKVVSTQLEVGTTALVVGTDGKVIIEGNSYADTIQAINDARADFLATYSYSDNMATITKDLTVEGTLRVTGEVIATDTETVLLQDNIIQLNSNATSGDPSENAGLSVMRGDRGELVFIQWNEIEGQMEGAWRDPNGGVISMRRLATEGDIDTLQTQITDNANHIGNKATLQTATQDNLVAAVNEVLAGVDAEEARAKFAEGDIIDLQTTTKSNLVAAINEVLTGVSDMFEKSGQDILFSGNLVPSMTNTFSIGSATNVIKDLHVSADTIHLGDSTTLSGTSLTVDAGVSPTSIGDQPTIVAGRLVAKPFTYNSGGGDIIVRPSIEFQDEGGISNPISFNSATGEFSFDRQGNFGQGLVRAKTGTFVNSGASALDVTGNSNLDGALTVTDTFRADGEVFLGFQASDIVHIRGTLDLDTPITFTENASIGDGNDDVTINSGPANIFSVASKWFNLDNTGNVTAQNVVVQGNLTVAGTTTTVSSETITFADNKLELNSNVVSGSPTENAGLSVRRGDNGLLDMVLWNETTDAVTVPVGSGTTFSHEEVATRPYVTGITTPMNTTLTNVKGGVGLLASGAYNVPTATNYLNASTSVMDSVKTLDTEVKARSVEIVNLGNAKFNKAGGTITGATAVQGALSTTGTFHSQGALYVGNTKTGVDQAINNDGSDIILGNTVKGLKTYKDLETMAGQKYYHETFKPRYSDDESLVFGDGVNADIKFVAAENKLKISSLNNGGKVQLTSKDAVGAETTIFEGQGNSFASLYNPANAQEVLRTRTDGIELAGVSGTRARLSNSATGQLHMNSEFGSVTIGASNSSWAHIATDRPSFHFSKSIQAVSMLKVYNADTYLTATAGKIAGANIVTTATGKATDSAKLNGSVNDTASAPSTIVQRDGSGDIKARLFRSEYDSTNANIGFIMTQVNTATDNFMRPSTPAQFRAAVTDATYFRKNGGDLTGDVKIVKNNPWLTLDSASTGGTGTDQGAGISIGESGKKGGAAVHVTYTGDGYGHIGMGTVNATSNLPQFEVLKMLYTSKDAWFQGNVTAVGDITAFSDVNTKEDIVTIENALDGIRQVRGVTYTRKSDGEKSIGVIAQELKEIFPQLVKTSEDDTLSVAYGNIAGVLIEGVKELASQNDAANAKIKELEEKYVDLAQKVEQLLSK